MYQYIYNDSYKGLDTPFFKRKTIIVTSCLLSYVPGAFWRGVYSIGKKANSVLLELTPFSEETNFYAYIDSVYSVYIPHFKA